MPPTDPTPTPTPREVLASAYCFSVHTRPGAPLDFSNELRPIGRPCEDCLRCADEALAALAATGDAPLAGDVLDAIEHPDFTSPEHLHRAAKRLLAAYTTLAAQLVAARARLALEERLSAQLCDYMNRDARNQLALDLGIDGNHIEDFRAALATPARPTDTGRDG